MSVQSKWKQASKDEPAEFELSYADVKVQVVRDDATGDIQVRLATTLNTDWMEGQFDEWAMDMTDSEVEEKAEQAYRHLKEWRDCIRGTGEQNAAELLAIEELVNAIEQANPGLIRG